MTDSRLHEAQRRLAIRRTGQRVPREQYLQYMTFQLPGPPLFTEIFGPLQGVREEWAQQGASPAELDMSAFPFRFTEWAKLAVQTGFHPTEPEQVFHESDDQLVARDGMGRTVQLSRRVATLPLPLDHPVATMDDWLRIKARYLDDATRFEPDWLERAEQDRQAGRVIAFHIPGGFDEPRQLMGEEGLCIACHDEPQLVEDILHTLADTACALAERICAQIQVDMLLVHDDMAGRSGPLIGPGHVRRFLVPYYHRVWDLLRSRGARLFAQDSDGDITPILPQLLDAGINLTYPCEPTGNMDVLTIRETYGARLALMGGIDKFSLLKGRDAIDAELDRKLPPLIRSGGVVLGLDHRIPNGVTLDAYRYYHARVWEIIGSEPER